MSSMSPEDHRHKDSVPQQKLQGSEGAILCPLFAQPLRGGASGVATG